MALLLLGAIFVVLPAALFFVLRWLARRWVQRNPWNPYAARITWTGWVVCTCLVLLLLASFAYGHAHSSSRLGRFFQRPINLGIAWAVAALFASLAERFLTKMGYPLRLMEAPPSVVFPPETELVKLPNFVPRGFNYGVEILNDNGTPMEFVVKVLRADLGLSFRDAARTMLSIHYRGGTLLPLASMSLAEAAAQAVSAKASAQKYPLTCRAVSLPPQL